MLHVCVAFVQVVKLRGLISTNDNSLAGVLVGVLLIYCHLWSLDLSKGDLVLYRLVLNLFLGGCLPFRQNFNAIRQKVILVDFWRLLLFRLSL